MFNLENGQLTLHIPEPSWWWILIPFILYGFVTHYVSLPGVRRYNKRVGDEKDGDWTKALTPQKLFILIAYRITLSLPVRIVSFVLGFMWVLISLVSCGKFYNNDCLRSSLRWYNEAGRIAYQFKWGPNVKGTYTDERI